MPSALASIPVYDEPLALGCCIGRLDAQEAPSHIGRPHRHPCPELFWITSGKAVHQSDLRHYLIDGGCFVLVPAGQVHAWQIHQPIAGYVITFNEELLKPSDAGSLALQLLRDTVTGAASPVIRVPLEARHEIDQWCEQLWLEQSSEKAFRLHALRARIELLLITCSRHAERVASPQASSRSAQICRAFLEHLERDFRKQHHALHYARLLTLSPQSLYSHVQHEEGKSPARCIEERLLLEARRLLHYSSLSIGEIAYELGFRTPSNFGRFYKRYSGISPGDGRTLSRTRLAC